MNVTEGMAGVTMTEVRAGAPTVKVAGVLIIPSRVAMIPAVPGAKLVAAPPALTLAAPRLVLPQATALVMSAVEWSE